MIVILALGRQRQKDHKFEVNLSYILVSCLQKFKSLEILFSGLARKIPWVHPHLFTYSRQ